MSEASKPPAVQPPAAEPARSERLAAALRENLKRRKAQARARLGPAKEAGKDKSPLK
jgi:hypothetical protein